MWFRNLKSLEVCTCGLWPVEFHAVMQFLQSVAWLISRQRSSGCTDAVWPLPLPLTCELFTTITWETTDALTSPRVTSILPVLMMGNNVNYGRNSWKDRL
ncbi:hypothetical protein AVEN_30059-1 [Araneus ventricosus]|uniref:Uncharacterized protein n=1 Tax=Araneus ventricosus TaxID=182803 RepID=A0A4Y2I6D3_ARAVE|nr:hypothetical protein AVEN_30059-1 [Araneus ventricosus]